MFVRSVDNRIQQNAEVVPFAVLKKLPADEIQKHLEAVKNEVANPPGNLSLEQIQRKTAQLAELQMAFVNALV